MTEGAPSYSASTEDPGRERRTALEAIEAFEHDDPRLLHRFLGERRASTHTSSVTPTSMIVMGRSLRVLLISGSLREGSTNTAVLRTANELANDGVTTTLYRGMADLPHFNPDDDREGEPVHAAVADLRAQIAAADAVLVCTPEYAGALPGALKNLLEWTVGDGGTYRKPIAWINASGPAAPTGGADAHDSLRKVLGYVHADIVEGACARIPLTRNDVGSDGTITDPAAREKIAETVAALARHVADRVSR